MAIEKTDLSDDDVVAVRHVFEDEVFCQYFMSQITKDLSLKGPVKNQDEFCAKGDDGHYLDASVEQAWWGFHRAARLSPELVVLCRDRLAKYVPPAPPRKKRTIGSHFNAARPTKS